MRILTISNCPLDDALGSGYVVLRYAGGLRSRGHHVDLLEPADYEPVPAFRRAIRYRQTLGMAVASARRLAGWKYDVIEFYGGESWLALSLLSRLPGRRVLLVCHSNGLETHCAEVLQAAGEEGLRRRWFQFDNRTLVARAFYHADAIVTVADYDRNFALRERYLEPDRVLSIDNALPDSYLGLQVDFARQPVIGYCGSWLPIKGTALMERDLPRLLRESPTWRLTLVGVGAGFNLAAHFPEDLLSRITVVPQADRESELRQLYQVFAIAILPSLYEGFGLAAAEAMACGCALVATRVGFAASLRHGENALLLGDPASPQLYLGLKALIEDPGLRGRIARAGHRRVQSLRWEHAVDQLETAYSSWLGELRQPDSRS